MLIFDTTFNRKPSLLRALVAAFGRKYLLIAIWKLCWGVFTWIASFWILKLLITFSHDYQLQRQTAAALVSITNNSTSSSSSTSVTSSSLSPSSPVTLSTGYLYALALGSSSLFSSICFHQLILQSSKIGLQCRAGLMVLIYRKSLKLSYVKGGIGDIVNLISNECNRIAEGCVNWHFLWSTAVECLGK